MPTPLDRAMQSRVSKPNPSTTHFPVFNPFLFPSMRVEKHLYLQSFTDQNLFFTGIVERSFR